ncbi:MAG: CheR family methyltransferase, partial [Pseudomonas sp.]
MNSDQRFFDFLKERIGLDVTSVGPAIIERAVRQRSIASQAPSADEYWRTLQGSQDEQQALIEAVIVPETWFFRYPESFATLAKLASKRLAEINNLRALRILSLPCSTGEEPYSIAMA